MYRLIAFALLATIPASGEWRRYFSDDLLKFDRPAAHSLDYFRAPPCMRKVDRPSCPPDDEAGEFPSTNVNIQAVGKIPGFTILEANYYLSDFQPEKSPEIKSILIQTGPDQFREIYVWEAVGPLETIVPGRIVNAGKQKVLVSKFDDGGNAGGQHDTVFALPANGAVLLDMKPVFDAAAKVVPEGRYPWNPASRFDFPSLTWKVWTNDGGKVDCCFGLVTVKFRIERDGRVVPRSVKYDAVPMR